MRRKPQRVRGQRRVDAILTAAAQLFAVKGYESATTNAIAAKAKIPIGSVYQFFPNKESILRELVTRHRADLQNLFQTLLTPESLTAPTAVLVDKVMDSLNDFGTSHTGFRPIFLHSPASPRLAAVAVQLDNEIVGRVQTGYAWRYPNLKPKQIALYATITVTMIKSLLSIAAACDEATRPQVVTEVKAVLSNYLDLLARYDAAAK